MDRTVYALLVGIDEYPEGVSSLHGCVNDVDAFGDFLRDRVAADDTAVDVRRLVNGEATREAVITGFREHLAQAAANDVAVFYYSGHGSQEPAPEEFWHLEPDRLNETLVCHDSRTEGGYDLADKELALLIAEVAASGAHLTVVLDSCHSGSGTRDPGDAGVRRTPTAARPRPIEEYIVTPDRAAEVAPPDLEGGAGGWFTPSQGTHVLLAACRDDEEAKEQNIDGTRRGVFSHFLLDTLQRTGAPPTYRDVLKRVRALVRNHAARQTPQLEATQAALADQPFLGGAVAAGAPHFTVTHDAGEGWVMDGGRVDGIPEPVGAETTVVDLYPGLAPAADLDDRSNRIGTAQVTAVGPARSLVEVSLSAGDPDPGETYKAVVVALPLPPTGVALAGTAEGVGHARAALAAAGPGGGASLLVAEAPPGSAELVLEAVDGAYRVRRTDDGRRLVADIPGISPATAAQAVQRLEHIARYHRILRLANPASRIGGAVEMQLYERDPADPDGDGIRVDAADLRLQYYFEGGRWRRPWFRLKLVNRSQHTVWCSLLDLEETFAVDALTLAGASSTRLEPGEEAWALEGNKIYGKVDEPLHAAGVTEIRDVLKMIVSTAPIEPERLEQGALDVGVPRSLAQRGVPDVPATTLNRLMDRVQRRGLTLEPEDEELSDWATSEFALTVVRLESAEVPRAGTAELGAGVALESHPALSARARLVSVAQASREVGSMQLPALLRDDPTVSMPFEITASRGGEPGLSALELFDVDDHTVVTPDEPLRLRIDASLGEGEHVLPIGHDGEFWLPLGRSAARDGEVELVLERLPAPADTRSLVGSIRILFQKVVSKVTGRPSAYPRLAAATITEPDEVEYEADQAAVAGRVAGADRILLYVHGIIGDTEGMAASAIDPLTKSGPAGQVLRDRYDLVLCFDYENLNTPLAEVAGDLRAKLAGVGLGPDHGKTLHVVAHSMGGLVSRWFVEQEGGDRVVQHLVTLGTPHQGSPWPKLQDWGTVALGIGLNALSSVFWPAGVLGRLVRAIERIDVSLDQMAPRSAFLNDLDASGDPGVPYTLIVGDTKLDALDQQGRFRRLLDKLLHGATNLAFWGDPNDIAVKVASGHHNPAGRNPAATSVVVACDHITYFSSSAGLEAQAAALP